MGINPRTWALTVWTLYLACVLSGAWPPFAVCPLVGITIAFVKRGSLAGSPFESHMISAIWTFGIFCAGVVVALIIRSDHGVSALFSFVLIGLVLFRCLRGLSRAYDGKPIEYPNSWL